MEQPFGDVLDGLKDFLQGADGTSYANAVVELGISEPAARMAASRMRGHYRELLRDKIAPTGSSQEDIAQRSGVPLGDLFQTENFSLRFQTFPSQLHAGRFSHYLMKIAGTSHESNEDVS